MLNYFTLCDNHNQLPRKERKKKAFYKIIHPDMKLMQFAGSLRYVALPHRRTYWCATFAESNLINYSASYHSAVELLNLIGQKVFHSAAALTAVLVFWQIVLLIEKSYQVILLHCSCLYLTDIGHQGSSILPAKSQCGYRLHSKHIGSTPDSWLETKRNWFNGFVWLKWNAEATPALCK